MTFHMDPHCPRVHIHQGWSIDSTHPSRTFLNIETIFDHLADYYPPTRRDSSVKKIWAQDVESFVQAHTKDVLSSPLFLRAPISVVQSILSLPYLSTSEDFVVSRAIHYATDAANVQSDAPAFWTPEERDMVLPILLQLFPFVRILSVSTKQFVLSIEPMKILSTDELIQKYKFDALAKQVGVEGGRSTDTHTIATIKRCYKDADTRREILQKGLRGTVAISESSHPYDWGEAEELEEVAVAAWAPRVLVEFDRRSAIGIGARLAFYKDADAKELLGTWHEMWPSGRHGVKTFVVESHKFFVGFSSCFFDHQTEWGWKLFVRPLFQPQDFI